MKSNRQRWAVWGAVLGLMAGHGVGLRAETVVEKGTVLLEVVIGPRGLVEETFIVEAPSVRLAAAATKDVRGHFFDPPRYRGELVKLQTVLAVHCELVRAANGEELLRTSFSNEVLVPRMIALPEYPDHALIGRISGWVEMAVEVDADGVVISGRVTGSEPAGVFDEAATLAMRRAVFHTDRVNGQAVGRRGVYRIEFEP